MFLFFIFLLLLLLFWFANVYSKWMCKSHFFWNSWCSAKEPMLFHLSRSPVYSNFKILVSFILICHDLPKEHVQRKSDIASFMEHPAYISFTMYSALILFFYFDFPLFTQNASVRVNCSWNFWCSPKGVVILLLSWSTLYIAVWKCIMSLFYFFCFVLPRFTQNASVKSLFSFEI